MLGYVRQKLRLIRYYSAPRRRTLLTRFVDVALVLALLLSFPAAWFANAEIERAEVLIDCDGHLTRGPDGGVVARVFDSRLAAARRQDVPYGEFRLRLVEQRRGWPVSSTVIQPHVELDLNIYDRPGVQRNATLAPDAPEYEAIHQALLDGRESDQFRSDDDITEPIPAYFDLIERWGQADRSVDRRVLGWAFNIGVCWVALSFAFSAVASGLWVLVMIVIHNRHGLHARRRSEGLCIHCGYDLYGLDFNERCPECGSIIY